MVCLVREEFGTLGGIIDVQRGSECSRVVIDAATVSDVDAERGRCEKGRGCFGGCDRDGNCDRDTKMTMIMTIQMAVTMMAKAVHKH